MLRALRRFPSHRLPGSPLQPPRCGFPPPPPFLRGVRQQSSQQQPTSKTNNTLLVYAISVAVAVGGLSYAAVPLYKVFCQATGYGGTTQKATEEKFKGMRPVEGARQITVHFSADTSAAMPWTFKPQQRSVRVVPGETALAFYTAHNPTAGPVTGVSTYNITPMRAAPYFNKIQCFCFEEQRLRPNEEIDMPVFFFIDPEFLNDPAMKNIQSITLAYCFHRTGELSVLDIQTELKKREVEGEEAKKKVQAWAEGVAARTGVALPGGGGGSPSIPPSASATPVVASPPQIA